MLSSLISSALQFILALQGSPVPTVSLGTAKVVGIANEGGVTQSFLGIPFAAAPRFNRPRPVKAYVGEIDGTAYGPACIQHDVMTTATESMKAEVEELEFKIRVPERQSEDCLSINVIRPATATRRSRLPVAVWFYGDGFLIGDSQTYDQMGKIMVEKSIANGEDVMFVSFNYRLSAYGFLAGKEAQDGGVGNIGLRDQREALHWVQKYIASFGGDPGRVVLWGQSAGAISASLQMLAYDGNDSGLFHGVFTQSGVPLPVGDIKNGQASFDLLVEMTGCGHRTDKLHCLRNADLDKLRYAVNATDSFFSKKSLAFTWTPRADGDFLTDNPYKLIGDRKVSPVPLVTGNVDDEGTLFSLAVLDIKSPPQFRSWIKNIWIPEISWAELEVLTGFYPGIPSRGSPFDTGRNNTLTKEYKRVSAFQGDMVFQAPRRFFTEELSMAGRNPIWVYLSKQFKETSPLGSSHGSDVSVASDYYLMIDHAAKFTKHLDPNLGGTTLPWPEYIFYDPYLYLFPAGDGSGKLPNPQVLPDEHRDAHFAFLTALAHRYPL